LSVGHFFGTLRAFIMQKNAEYSAYKKGVGNR